jgi:hypothetical protein
MQMKLITIDAKLFVLYWKKNRSIFVFFGLDCIYFNLAYFFISITSTKRLAAILKISVLLYSPVGEYNSLIRQI